MMDSFKAAMLAEGNWQIAGYTEEPPLETFVEAWQYLVDTGMAWQLQGKFGRTAMDLIRQGIIIDTHKVAA